LIVEVVTRGGGKKNAVLRILGNAASRKGERVARGKYQGREEGKTMSKHH